MDRQEIFGSTRSKVMSRSHHWSGWPGAYCLKCGAEDPMEIAIGENWYDPCEDRWDSEEHRQQCLAANVCSVEGTLRWDVASKRFKLETVS